MHVSKCVRILCVWCCLFVAIHRSVVAQGYAIKVDRPEQVGNVYSVVIKGTREGSLVGIEGDVPLPESFTTKQTTKISAELDATIQILDTDRNGRVLKQSISVNRFQFDTDE